VVRTSELKTLVEGETRVTLRAAGLRPEVVSGLAQWGRDVRADDGQVTLTVDGEGVLPVLNRYLVSQNVDVYALTPQKLSLEDLFIQIVGTDGGL